MSYYFTSDNNFGPYQFIVNPIPGQGTHTTIQDAINSAVAINGINQSVIAIYPGVYTENLNFPNSVGSLILTLVGINPEQVNNAPANGSLQIRGVHTTTNNSNSCNITFENISLIDNVSTTYFFNGIFSLLFNNSAVAQLSTTTAFNLYSASTLFFNNSSFNSSSGSFIVDNSVGNIYFVNSNLYFGNGSTTTINSTMLSISNSNLFGNFIFGKSSGTSFTISSKNSNFTNLYNTSATITLNATANNSSFTDCYFSSGTSFPALSIASSTICNLFGATKISSTASPVISGSGTLIYDPIAFEASGNSITVSTQTPLSFGPNLSVQSITLNGGTALGAYITGTYTPTITGATTAGTTTYTGASAKYIKIGTLVYIYGGVSWSAATGTGIIVLGGLPFTIASASGIAQEPGIQLYSTLTITGATQIYGLTQFNTTNVNIIGVNVATGTSINTSLAANTNNSIAFVGVYQSNT